MLEAETVRLANKLIRGLTQNCIESFEAKKTADSRDLEALAALISAIGTSTGQLPIASSVIGFNVDQAAEDCDGDNG